MIGDIIQTRTGQFLRDNADGTYDNLSDPAGDIATNTYPKVALPREYLLLARNGAVATDHPHLRMAAKVAVCLARRYA
jgi:hypothetical protein